jgi:hypothetical protein
LTRPTEAMFKIQRAAFLLPLLLLLLLPHPALGRGTIFIPASDAQHVGGSFSYGDTEQLRGSFSSSPAGSRQLQS